MSLTLLTLRPHSREILLY